jgi:hypothetical protein
MLTHLIRVNGDLWSAAQERALEQGCRTVDEFVEACLRSALSSSRLRDKARTSRRAHTAQGRTPGDAEG